MNRTLQLLSLIEQVAGGMDELDGLLADEVDRRLQHPEELTLVVAQCLEAQHAIDELLARLRPARRTLRRTAHLLGAAGAQAVAETR